MKKLYKGLIVGAAALGMLAFTGCEDLLNLLEEAGGEPKGYAMVTATETKTFNYSSSNPIFKITPEVKTVNINGNISGKKAYLVRRNIGNTDIVTSDIRGFVDSNSRSAALNQIDLSDLQIPEPEFKHFHAPAVAFDKSAARSARSVAAPVFAVTPVSRTPGTAKKMIYVDTNFNMNVFEQKPATLRAAGTYCNVWVIDEYFTTGSASGKLVNQAIADKYAAKFDAMYKLITEVFGDESNYLINYTKKVYKDNPAITDYLTSITELSDTGDKINIVVYDIGNDYALSKKTGVLGYFYSKDYYYGAPSGVAAKSNAGKYFYIDAPYAVSNFNDTVSTLAHEFQHMINFNQKNLNPECDETPSAGYNEMLSMLCEDMMQSHLGLADKDSPKNRIQQFNGFYFMSGIDDYLEQNSSFSYSTNYAFGSWLARQYGGAELVKWFSQSPYVDEESIETAVMEVQDNYNLTFEEIFQKFLLALTGSSTYTHNRNAAQTLSYESYRYPMTAFNLWSSTYGYNDFNVTSQLKKLGAIDGSTWTGPVVFKREYAIKLPAHNGISIHQLTGLDIINNTLRLTDYGSENEIMYLIIQ